MSRVLLVVDQLEELVTLADSRQSEVFLAALAAALEEDRQLRVLATLRVEFLPGLLAMPHGATARPDGTRGLAP